ncbi:MAG: glutaminyl-peptide cyclotransferase [Bacteroidales bacterium]|nr:glutaminyl-peptide cyclotransferase [Bacteroidales bacterium]
MNAKNMSLLIKRQGLAAALPLLFVLLSCCTTNTTKPEKPKKSEKEKAKSFFINKPLKDEMVQLGSNFDVLIGTNKELQPDSVVVSHNGKKMDLYSTGNFSFSCNPAIYKPGRKLIDINIFYSDSLAETHRVFLLFLPIDAPKQLSYKVVRSFPHDPEAYTQGLFYHKGYLYESTGQPNRSSVRCVDPKTGEVLRKRKLEPQYFGEGIALVGDEIFMLTYREHKGFVFKRDDFSLIRTFDLQTEEGWGLTNYGNKLLLSDGSAFIYFFNPEFFTLESQIEVCNNTRLVNNLNELELTPDGLFANIYGQNTIVAIDPETGIVTHTLDLSALFPPDVPHDMDHVLNGIAYNPDTKTYYITGKQWPVMYEIGIFR